MSCSHHFSGMEERKQFKEEDGGREAFPYFFLRNHKDTQASVSIMRHISLFNIVRNTKVHRAHV